MMEQSADQQQENNSHLAPLERLVPPERLPLPGLGWMQYIKEIYVGHWTNCVTGRTPPACGIRLMEIADTLEGREAELIRGALMQDDLALVADENTWEASGRRIAGNLKGEGIAVGEVILQGRPKATLAAVEALGERLRGFESVIAVGSGTINDLVKYETAKSERDYCIFATAASMDGYTSRTASMTLASGLKQSLPAHMPVGVFFDIGVIAAAPPFLAAAGYGDCLCNSVAHIDWWMSHRLLGTPFHLDPYLIADTESEVFGQIAPGIAGGDEVAIGWLIRSLVLSGLGVAFTGTSHHGSMGEHQISHYIDCFAGARHPGTLHGAQVGVASLSMSRIQQWFLRQERPPVLRPTRIDRKDMERRMGKEIAKQCAKEYRAKALNEKGAEEMNRRLAEIWDELRAECLEWVESTAAMTEKLRQAGGATTAGELGVPADFYREAVRHGHEMRNRFSFADLACDAGLLDDFAAAEV